MIIDILLLTAAIAGVVKGADWFLGAAEKIGLSLRLPPFILGVILVGFGTSLPELATSVAAVIDNQPQVAIPNIVGSNLANIFLILGLTTMLLGTVKFQKNLIDLDLPLLLGVTVLFTLMIADGQIALWEASLLLIGFIGYILYALLHKENNGDDPRGLLAFVRTIARGSNKKQSVTQKVLHRTTPKADIATWLIGLGALVLLAGSSKVAVDSLLGIVNTLGIGVGILTFFTLAIGTSLPELLVSIKAVRAGKGDLALGNIIGSCIFNILMIGGIAGVLSNQSMPETSILWAIGGLLASTVLLAISSISRQIHAWEGFLFVLIYGVVGINIFLA